MFVARKSFSRLLDQIHDGALDSNTNLADLLRKCIALGGETQSERLRDWATQELMGYWGETEIPDYRKTASPLFLDGATVRARVVGQQVPLAMIPVDIRQRVRELMDNVEVRHSVSQVVDLVETARRSGEGSVKLSPPHQQELVALINAKLADDDQKKYSSPGPFGMAPSQVVERVYWQVSVSDLVAIIDGVRTTLVRLVVEIRAATPESPATPSREAAEQAVDVAVYGKVRNLVISQVGAESQGAVSAGATAVAGDAKPESLLRRWMWWIVGIATIVGAVAAVLALVVL